MSRWAAPKANAAVRSTKGPMSRWAAPEANAAVRSTKDSQ
jgi:hypothetical protein